MRQNRIVGEQAVRLDDGRWLIRAAIALASGLLLVRLVVIGKLGFFPDEVYYWVWSQHLAFGFFDHPALPESCGSTCRIATSRSTSLASGSGWF